MVDARYIGIGEEGTYNTAATIVDYIDQLKENFKTIVPPVYAETVAKRAPSKHKQGAVHSEGDFDMFVESQNGIGWLLKWLLGTVSSATPSGETEVYEHTYTDGLTVKSFTVAIGRDSEEIEFAGCKISKAVFSANVKEFLMATFSVIGGKKEAVNAIGVPSFTTEAPFIFHEGKLEIDDAENTDVSSVKLEIDNGIKIDDARVFNAQEPKESKLTSLGISGEIQFIDPQSSVRTKFLAGTVAKLELVFIGTTVIGNAEYPELHITLPVVVYEEEESGTDKRDIRKQRDTFKAKFDPSSDYTIQVILTNEATAY